MPDALELMNDEAAPGPVPAAPTTPALLHIRPTPGWRPINLRELWQYRELLYFLVWRDIKIRYKQTVLGATWAVIQPLFTMVVFTLLFGTLAGMPSDDIPYPLFSYAALLAWTYFANALSAGSGSLVGSSNLINKVYFPRLIVPAASVLAGMVDYAIAFVVLLGLMLCYGRVPPVAMVVTVPLLSLLLLLFSLGTSLWLSALNVEYRDIRFVVPFLVQLWMFVTPVIWPLSRVPERYRWLLMFNPMAGIVEGYRSALFGRPWDIAALSVSVALTALLLVGGAFYFRRLERSFADVV